ncbi:unnamed protein product [Pieris macdunnoughi]|uniref:Uncharacterized protein n=1 Tax=Pieris macdunnoughi TaxID=345717 RepID=A0A821Y6X0_9NEOP|nr:unnamed protein product [Pieris macdunnoughi]
MNRYNAYMENLRRSKNLALDLIDDTKDIIEEDQTPIKNIRLRTPSDDLDLSLPSTSKEKPTEYVKYGKITFNTTAILHHYPQMNNTENHLHHTKRHSKDKVKIDNNNVSKPQKVETKVTINDDSNCNNNESIIRINSVNNIESVSKPVKFTEEKLV